MRILHTADWQIGMKAVHLRARADEVRRKRFEAARRVIEIARRERADLLILAGDTFEHPAVARPVVREVANLLSDAPCPVCILPGNHDPACPGSVWEDECWRAASNVTLALSARPLEVAGAIVYPCPALARNSVVDPTAWIPPRTDNRIRIGVAHGSVEGRLRMDPCFPIAAGAAERFGLDYLALGHFHSTAVGVGGSARMAYCGTHEPTGFGERDSGNVLLVEIEAAGTEPRIHPLRTRVLEWLTMERDVVSATDLENVLADLQSVPDPEQKLVRCLLSGEAVVEDDVLERIAETLENRFVHGELDSTRLVTAGGSAWVDELPPGYIRTLGTRLRQEGNEEDAAAALHHLRRLWREVRA